LIGNNSGSIKDAAVNLRLAGGFRLLRIDWCDRQLCHVTGRHHVHRSTQNNTVTALTRVA